MNNAILESIQRLNAYAGIGYRWWSSLDGSVGDVTYKGTTILRGNPDNFTYCCGITLQAYIEACERIGKDLGSVQDVRAIQRAWFIVNPVQPIFENKGPGDALIPRGHGTEVTLEEAMPGDLCQIWRESGSGHSVIFIKSYTEGGKKALQYWSTQPATKGIGYRTEYFNGVKNPITHIHITRPI